MKLYRDFCFTDLSGVVDAVMSAPILGDGSVITSAVINGTSVDVTTNKPGTFSITPPECSVYGPVDGLGISFADSQDLSWLVTFVLVSAFALKVLRRGL